MVQVHVVRNVLDEADACKWREPEIVCQRAIRRSNTQSRPPGSIRDRSRIRKDGKLAKRTREIIKEEGGRLGSACLVMRKHRESCEEKRRGRRFIRGEGAIKARQGERKELGLSRGAAEGKGWDGSGCSRDKGPVPAPRS